MNTKIAHPALLFRQLADYKLRMTLESTSAVKSSTVLTTKENANMPEVMIKF
jgi:hypothetical protein